MTDAFLYEKAQSQVLLLIARGRITMPEHPAIYAARLHMETLIRQAELLDRLGREDDSNIVRDQIGEATKMVVHLLQQQRAGRI
jgi:hypothetical protein